MEYAVLVVALLLALYNWWLVRSVRRDLQRVNPERLTQLVDELVATAEEAASAVAERTERLELVIAQADRMIADLRSPGAGRESGGRQLAGAPGQPPTYASNPVQGDGVYPRNRAGTPGERQQTDAVRPKAQGARGAPVLAADPDLLARLTGLRRNDVPAPEPERPVRIQSWEPAELAAPDADLPAANDQMPAPDRSRADVYFLADSGMDPQGIARKLNMTRGEVELILGLRRMN